MIMNSIPADYEISQSARIITFRASGNWTLENAKTLDAGLLEELNKLDYDKVNYDFTDVESLDTVGAYLFARAIRRGQDTGQDWSIIAGSEGQKTLMKTAADAVMGRPPKETRQWYDALSRIGQATERFSQKWWKHLSSSESFLPFYFACFSHRLKFVGSLLSL